MLYYMPEKQSVFLKSFSRVDTKAGKESQMKKFLDRYLFSRMGLQIAFSVAAILVFSIVVTCIKIHVTQHADGDFYNRLTWGFRQITDGGSAAGTLAGLDKVASDSGNAPVVLCITLLSWLAGMVLYSFVTGAIVNAFVERRDLIASGQARYKFKGHGIVIGWDYQGVATVKNMLTQGIHEVLIVSKTPSEDIRSLLGKKLNAHDMARIFLYNKSICMEEDVEELQAEYAKIIVVLGEQEDLEKDGENLRAERLLRVVVVKKIQNTEKRNDFNLPIKLYLHIEDPLLYTQARAKKEGFAEDGIFDLELCNFYESWAWRCWSQTDSADSDGQKYLPLRYKPDSDRVELFVIGSNAMGQAIINYAIPLMNYGADHKHCKITLFDIEGTSEEYLPKKHIVDALPEVEVEYRYCVGGSEDANDIMWKAVKRKNTSVTIIIAVPGVDAAVKAYAALSYKIRRERISVLVWQSTETGNCIDKGFLQTGGDQTELRYFGMTDILPWTDSKREEFGRDINYCYEIISRVVDTIDFNRIGLQDCIGNILKQCFEHPYGKEEKEQAEKQWYGIKRWKRWSSINSGDSFKEKAFAFRDCISNTESCIALIRAEHNRWWTERLLAGWFFGERDDERFLHPDLVPFDRLDVKTQALDLLFVLAMKNAGLLN